MKHAKYLVALALFAFAVTAFAQQGMDSRAERAVHITQGPAIIHNNGSTAVLEWTTDKQGANNVEYRRAGSNEGWRKAYHSGGGTHHQIQMTGLHPGDTYEYRILTRDGDVRTGGQFRANGRDNDHDRDDRRRDRDKDKDHDRDHDKH